MALRVTLPVLFLLLIGLAPARADPGPSQCLAMAQAPLPVRQANMRPSADPSSLERNQVRLTFVGHSTFRIETAGGVIIATDYAGWAGPGVVPDAVTMNHAHGTHYTDSPDPRIGHVLRGWNPGGGPARHDLEVGDVRIRNVPTDIRLWSGGMEPDGNSIFIFEVAGLCIGHLGHLHHELRPEHIGLIGRLDIVMVPVDGSYTMAQANMIEVLKTLRARLVLPMHYFGSSTLQRFLAGMGREFEVEVKSEPTLVVSAATLPDAPKIIVLPGY